ncbi:MAG: GTPase/DUF3482 domain-containing protein [bacterium]|nr:GTPase/DUF3482 domain-containing protein [bacterium]
MSTPRLAVVGHPNKGKSSLVATLAEDDSVGIGPTPGTTLRTREYPMSVEGRLLYTLIDTPGFQRARRVLTWLQERAAAEPSTAADRPRLVAEFVAAPGHAERFPDECELLRPLVEGAGILYVVDGGVPYGPEYEAEMEVLRWTGRPSLAVVNPIGRRDHVADWEAALGQFFRIVRVIDALHADFETRRQLLLAFAELEADWRAPIAEAVAVLDAARDQRRRETALEIAHFVADGLALATEKKLGPSEDVRAHEAALEREYRAALDALESAHRSRVQRLHGHRELEATASALELLEADLFDEGTWLAFGLRRRDLVTVGAIGGAATGGVIDASVGGAAFLVGTAIGGAVGGVLGWLGADRLAELSVVDRPLGGRLARFGPSKNPNFPFVLFGRARFHAGLVAARTHARRDVMALESGGEGGAALPLDAAHQRSLARIFGALRKQAPGSPRYRAAIEELTGITAAILEEDADERPIE